MGLTRTSDAAPGDLSVAGVVILAGGVGTRLRSVVTDTQKVVAPVGGRPMLAYLLEQCSRAGVRDVTLAVGYRVDTVRESLGDSFEGIRLHYSEESSPMGTGGAIALASSGMQGGPVIVLNGDSFLDVDLAAVLAWHRARRARATMVLTEVPDGSRFGAVTVDAERRVVRFAEKDANRTGPAVINAGIYVVEPEVLREMPAGPHSIEHDVFPSLAGNGLFGWQVPGRFIDIGLPETYARAADVIVGGAPPTSGKGYVVLDRDGTIIEERHYLHDPDEVALLPGAAEGLRAMQMNGMRLVIATNQAGIGRGIYAETDFAAVQRRLAELLAAHDVSFDAVFHCPHRPDAACACRKPETGMVDEARALFGGDAPIAVVGDKTCDIALARAVGAAGILVRTGYGDREFAGGLEPEFLVDDLRGAAHVVQELMSHQAMPMSEGR